jgi:hypothetical protein
VSTDSPYSAREGQNALRGPGVPSDVTVVHGTLAELEGCEAIMAERLGEWFRVSSELSSRAVWRLTGFAT